MRGAAEAIISLLSARGPKYDSYMPRIESMIFDQDFLEKLVFLALTALVTGFGIPYVLKRIEDRKLRQQKQFEAELSRQTKIIEAQSKLLDDLSETLWKWRYQAKKVVYYGAEESKERFDDAAKEYDDGVWEILNEFSREISRSRRLVSEKAYQELRSLYDYIVRDIDPKISAINKRGELNRKTVEESEQLSVRFSSEVTQRIDDEIDRLASELDLKVRK